MGVNLDPARITSTSSVINQITLGEAVDHFLAVVQYMFADMKDVGWGVASGVVTPRSATFTAQMIDFMKMHDSAFADLIGLKLADALQSYRIGQAIGASSGDISPNQELMAAIAQAGLAALDSSAAPSAMYSMLADLKSVDGLLDQNHTSQLYYKPDVVTALTEIAVQYAGDLALQKAIDAATKNGLFELIDNADILKASFDPNKWKSTFNLGGGSAGQKKIVGVDDMIVALGNLAKRDGASAFSQEILTALGKWAPYADSAKNITLLEMATSATGVTLDGSDKANANSGADGGAILVGGARDDLVFGSKGDDFIIGGAGDDVFFSSDGADLIFGGDGDDSYVANSNAQGKYLGGVIFFGGADSGGQGISDADTADYTAISGKVTITFDKTLFGYGPEDKSRATVSVSGAEDDKLYGVEEIYANQSSDRLILKNYDGIEDFLNSLPNASGTAGKTPLIDLRGQAVDMTPTGSIGGSGDTLDTTELGGDKALVFNLRDQDAQFVADMEGAVPTRLGLDGKVPTNSFEAAKFAATVVAEMRSPTDLSGYAAGERLNLKNVESVAGTEMSDLIIGADTVYTWRTPDPTPENPDPQPERVVDKDFRGYELKGNGGDDTILVYKGSADQINWRLIDGGDGNDVVVARDAGKQYYVDPETGQQIRSEIRGGAGDDVIFSIGSGEGGDVIGGAGSDLLYNTAYKGRIWGDSVDGTGERSRDVFLWSPGSFIMDAGEEDLLQFFGLPLTGGTGVKHETGEQWAYDWVLPFIRYGLSDSGQLIVQSWIGNIVNHIVRSSPGDDILRSSMIVENFDQGAGGNWAHIARGDLGMTFRIWDFNASEKFGGFESVWGMLINRLDALKDFGKMLKWVSADDPLVLDLDGDGIETTERDFEGVHFDFNGDRFAELSGWVGADDGFLVMDRDGNGKIDDISELFGAPGGSGFAELRLVDEDATGLADGRINASDIAFTRLQVWRDLNQDGVSQSGELFSLSDLGIVSIDAIGDALNVTSPSGTLLREKASFTRADGSTGYIFEAIFETDPIDTVFTGDRGTAGWAARGANGAVIDDKGFGRLADLSVALSNDLALNETVKSVAASMTTRRRMRQERTGGHAAFRRPSGRKFFKVQKSKIRWGVKLQAKSLSL